MNEQRIREGDDLGHVKGLLSGLRNQLRLEILLDAPICGVLLLSLTVVIMRLERSDFQNTSNLRLTSTDMVFGGQGVEDVVSFKSICLDIWLGKKRNKEERKDSGHFKEAK